MTKQKLNNWIISNKDFIHISNELAFQQKLSNIIQSGAQHLHIISDFDMTLTKYWVNGKRSMSSHGVLENYSKLPHSFKEKSRQIYDTFYPIEISPTIPLETKILKMEEWWTTAHELIIQQGLTKHDISQMVIETPITFRTGIDSFIHELSAKDIPVLVFSAGIANIIEEILYQAKYNTPQLHIVSNKLGFNSAGVCDHFEGNLIHVFNKNEANVSEKSYQELISNRRNVILMGDSLGDLKMADGVEHETKLTIGFLNHDKELLLEKYAKEFDIVILDDSPLDFINELISCL